MKCRCEESWAKFTLIWVLMVYHKIVRSRTHLSAKESERQFPRIGSCRRPSKWWFYLSKCPPHVTLLDTLLSKPLPSIHRQEIVYRWWSAFKRLVESGLDSLTRGSNSRPHSKWPPSTTHVMSQGSSLAPFYFNDPSDNGISIYYHFPSQPMSVSNLISLHQRGTPLQFKSFIRRYTVMEPKAFLCERTLNGK